LSRIAIFIPARQAASVIQHTLERIPDAVWDQVEEVFVNDNCSTDGTAEVVELCIKTLGRGKLKLLRMDANHGYGGSKKKAYRYVVEAGFDFVVMLHADGQYPPEYIPDLLEPLVRGEFDMAQGSRIKHREGGMPLYKRIANRGLNFFEGAVFGYKLQEYHSGFRAYSCKALARLPLELMSDGHLITAEMLALFKFHGMRIVDIGVPTVYSDTATSCSFRTSMKYGLGVFWVMFQFLMARLGISISKVLAKNAKSG
jgi:glycosyltransferase involved in cell wall biosynthesis